MRSFTPLSYCALWIAIVIPGCATWPTDWPPLAQLPQAGCPNVSGTYADAGRSTMGATAGWNRSLSYRLLHYRPDIGGARVRISQRGDEQLDVEITRNGDVLQKGVLVRTNGDFECDGDGLWLKPTLQVAADGAGYTRSSTSLGLRPGEGSILAGQERTRGFGLLLWIVPLPGEQTIWYRWDPIL